MTNFINKNIKEIQANTSLVFYGFALSLTHLWTFFYWNQHHFFVNSQSSLNAEPLCFPFFPNCDLWRNLIPQWGWTFLLFIYLFLSVVNCLLFYDKKRLKLAYSLLFFVTLFKFSLQFSNYNFMGNYHYMVYIVTFLYLFVSEKKKAIPIIIVGFYFAAGILKLNVDWLSGAAMIYTPILNGTLLSLSLYYVVFLELIFSFGLLSEKRWIRLSCLIQFVAFHIFSWHIVGFFYPLIMFSLLSLFFIEELFNWKKSKKGPEILKDFLNFRLPHSHYFLLFVFVLMQAFPFLLTPDPSLTGALRLSSLNMFDSKTECHALLVVHRNKDSIHLDRPIKPLGVRLHCDPLMFLNQAHQLCRQNKIHKDFDRLSLSLRSKRVTQINYTQVFDFNNICDLPSILWAEFFKGSKI